MERDPLNTSVTMAEAQQAIADTVRTELELGMTFLDVAENTADRKHALQSVRNAITALRTANRFLSEFQLGTFDIDVIEQRRKQLAQRLCAICCVDDWEVSPDLGPQ